MTGRLLHGTSSWSEKSWVGAFYPEGCKPADYLAHYARAFPTVEADVTYYRVPSRSTIEGWARKSPEGFRIAAKFPRSVVHAGEGPRPDGEVVLVPERVGDEARLFLERMALLGDRLGPLVLQLPYYNKQAFPSKDAFLERLDAFMGWLPGGFHYAVEVRNERWIDDDLLSVLRRYGAALVWVDIAYMRHPADLAAERDLLTADFAYGRLIGDRKRIEGMTTTFDRVVLDQGERLERWADLLRQTLERVPETYVYANNHYAGFGPGTIRELVARITGDRS